MSSARSRLRSRAARASLARGCQREAAVAHHAVVTPCQHDDVPSGSQNSCASMCVWPSTNPGVTTWPSASISSRARAVDLADGHDPPVRRRRRRPRTRGIPVPSTTVPLRITEVVSCPSNRGYSFLPARVLSALNFRCVLDRPRGNMVAGSQGIMIARWPQSSPLAWRRRLWAAPRGSAVSAEPTARLATRPPPRRRDRGPPGRRRPTSATEYGAGHHRPRRRVDRQLPASPPTRSRSACC